MARDADIASASLDVARIGAVSAALGPRRLGELVVILAGRIETLADSAEMFPQGAEECLPVLHQSRGSAASLGFVALAHGLACMEARLKQAQAGGRDAAAAWEAVRQSGLALRGLLKEALLAFPRCDGG